MIPNCYPCQISLSLKEVNAIHLAHAVRKLRKFTFTIFHKKIRETKLQFNYLMTNHTISVDFTDVFAQKIVRGVSRSAKPANLNHVEALNIDFLRLQFTKSPNSEHLNGSFRTSKFSKIEFT